MSDVVVVLPCAPATAIPYFMRISSASISARGITGMLASRARVHLGIVGGDRGRRRPRRRRCRRDRRGGRSRSARRAARGDPSTSVSLRIGARDLESEVEQHLGDAAHAGAADADEVNSFARARTSGTPLARPSGSRRRVPSAPPSSRSLLARGVGDAVGGVGPPAALATPRPSRGGDPRSCKSFVTSLLEPFRRQVAFGDRHGGARARHAARRCASDDRRRRTDRARGSPACRAP